MNNKFQFSSVQSLRHVWLFVTRWTAARQASLSITNSQSLLKHSPLSRWYHPTISSSSNLLLRLQSFPASGSFPMSLFFAQMEKRKSVTNWNKKDYSIRLVTYMELWYTYLFFTCEKRHLATNLLMTELKIFLLRNFSYWDICIR